MGREIRMVPPNYKHPETIRSYGDTGFQPMFNKTFASAVKEWKENFKRWEAGERPSYYTKEEGEPELEFWEYDGGPPQREYYRSWEDEEGTWYQVWETVTEGTPVTPPFATKEELVEYLVTNGDFWDQQRRKEKMEGKYVSIDCGPWDREYAESFVYKTQWAPSGIFYSKA